MKLSSFSAVLTMCLIVGVPMPTSVLAERWDYLFDELSWTSAEAESAGEDWSLSVGSFSDVRQDWGFTDSEFWDYLFSDLTWPEASFAVEGLGSEE
ncbi:hypothetical protein AUJ46_06240 [Candidatus Peregrinibacteria bacterium CG1_02_54_53]|nr:MAG: hypothetical protein AUJ46_06240 [Candidatus Peregrinibacteria bacterium CG1_02_54_53]